MTSEETDITWLDEHQTLSFNDLLALSGLSQSALITLVEHGALLVWSVKDAQLNRFNLSVDDDLSSEIADQDIGTCQDTKTWLFSSQCLVSIRTLCRLKADFELEDNALSLIMVYLERIRLLEAQLQQLEPRK